MSSRTLNLLERCRIIVLHEQGLNISEISEELGLSRHTVRLWIRRHEEEGNVKTRRRKKIYKIGVEDIRNMVATYEMHPLTPTKVFAEQFNCSPRTVRRAFEREGIFRTHDKKSIMTDADKEARVQFVRQYRNYDFSKAIFVGGKILKCSPAGRLFQWGIIDDAICNARNIKPDDSDCIVVNLWGWMSAAGPGELVEIPGKMNGHKYMALFHDTIFPTVRVVYPAQEAPELIIFQDKCSFQTTRMVKRLICTNPGIQIVQMPACSPDFNPIEDVWAKMVQQWDYNNNQRTKEAILTHCHSVWEALRGDDIGNRLAESMKARCDAVIAANGEATEFTPHR